MFDNRDDPEHLRSCIKKLTEQWFGYRGPWHGIAEEKLANTRLPRPLQWLYGFAGEWPSDNCWETVFAYQDMLLPFEALFSHDGKLVFVSENQGVWNVGTLPYGDDPPVWVRKNEDDAPWHRFCDSLTDFLVTFCLHEIVFGARYQAHSENILDQFSQLDCHISPLWLNAPYVYLFDDKVSRPISFHMVDGHFLVMDNGWCGTSVDEPWVQFPGLFEIPDSPSLGLDMFAPIPEHLNIPDFIRKSHLENLIWRHASQVEYHHEMIEKYTCMLDDMDENSR